MSNQQVARRETQVMDALQYEGVKNQLANLLENSPRKMEAFKTRVLKMSLSYGLKDCTPESIINCGLQALTLDLPLEAGQGYIVNYGGQAQFDCGYKGWQVLAKRAGYSVQADVVYSCDQFHQDGYGFDREMTFIPDWSSRKGSDDKWAKKNLVGVIVSILEDETKNKTTAFVPADMIHKIVGTSPSQKSEKGKQYSPHENWAEQMFAAKAIKQVLSKFAIDIAKSSQLAEAIAIVNSTESQHQEQARGMAQYSQERMDENYPKWVELVKSGKKTAMSIITQLSNGFSLTEDQMSEVMALKNYEPIEGNVAEAETDQDVSVVARIMSASNREELDTLLSDADNPDTPKAELNKIKAAHAQRINELAA